MDYLTKSVAGSVRTEEWKERKQAALCFVLSVK